ncbi:glycosyltransferase [Pseudomonas sp. Irchel s3b5]|uniref:glycosyltransferase n=1 Tax=Pseudomonas sp. Irchel s3b5 TaxID=2009077 RepID=UPI00117A2F76|nr:glycosyltransferase [Pseudomonas sp. Irchel s3b5]
MIKYVSELREVLNIVPGSAHAWIGDSPTDTFPFVSVDILNTPGFRTTPADVNRFDVVWILQDPISLQGWRILLDSSIRMLKSSGILIVRYVQNRYISIPSLKNFLYRKYGLTVSVCAEIINGEEIVTAFKIDRQYCIETMNKRWTFGILTQGKKIHLVAKLCKTIRDYGGCEHQIIIVGPQNAAYDEYEPIYIEKQYSTVLSDICVKKNDMVNLAAHENLCILHDRYWLGDDFFIGFEKYGYDFDFLTIRQQHQSGKNYPSYCAIDDKSHLIWGPIYECGNEHQTWNRHYLNGGLIVAKKSLLQLVPFNPLIFHNQAEDVELAKQLDSISIVPRINRYSSAITDVPDHLTDAFTVSEETDYERVFFPQNSAVICEAEPTEILEDEKIVDVNSKPWGRLQGIVNRIETRRRAGASWKGVVFLGLQMVYRRLFKPRNLQLSPVRKRLSSRPSEVKGVNVILYAGESGGVVNLTTHYMNALQRKGIPFCIVDVAHGVTPNVLPDNLQGFFSAEPVYPTNIWCIGFPFIEHHLNKLSAWADARWNVNFTHWELPHIPKRLVSNFDAIDSIMVDTEFVYGAIASVTKKTIELVDPEVRVPFSIVERYGRSYFDLPTDKILFLLNWEFTSSTIRKNPNAGLRAFTECFVDVDDVALVLHVKFEIRHGSEKLREYEAFLETVRLRFPNVIVLNTASFSYNEALGLKRSCDVYVSLHRSEGYGMGCAESLALGRRCVMTGWSGNMELLKNAEWRDSIYTVDVSLVPVTPEDYPWVDTEDDVCQVWAEVKHEDAVRAISKAYCDVKSSMRI